jgi:hypothetical protein
LSTHVITTYHPIIIIIPKHSSIIVKSKLSSPTQLPSTQRQDIMPAAKADWNSTATWERLIASLLATGYKVR